MIYQIGDRQLKESEAALEAELSEVRLQYLEAEKASV
jgi:hypothetical protein